MGFVGKVEALNKKGAVKKGYREIQRKDGTVRYMTDVKKKPELKTKKEVKKPAVKKPAVKKPAVKKPAVKKVKMSDVIEESAESNI